jgi:hypothetical protein
LSQIKKRDGNLEFCNSAPDNLHAFRVFVPFVPVPFWCWWLFDLGTIMKEKRQQKLLLWGQLHRQCDQVEQHLRSATSKDRDQSGPDPGAI